MDTKFALRSPVGASTQFFSVSSESVVVESKPIPRPSHHVLVVDRSGSMYGDIPDIRKMLGQLLTLEEFVNPTLKVSLISYSGKGDVKLHFAKVSVKDVADNEKPYSKDIDSLRSTGMTCISQALVMAKTILDYDDVTAITLHTDGYANDSSPTQEVNSIRDAVNALKHPNVFCNTIAHRDYCDFNLLASIANELSGVCIQARKTRDVYDAMYATTQVLNGAMEPALELGVGSYDYVVYSSPSKILGSAKGLTVRGRTSQGGEKVYRYKSISQDAYNSSSAPESKDGLLAFARAQIAEGNLNTAKFALVSYQDPNLYHHLRALTSSSIASFASDVEKLVFAGTPAPAFQPYGIGDTGPSILQVLNVLDKYSNSVSVNLPELRSNYVSRSLKTIPGIRGEDGNVTPPYFETKAKSDSPWVDLNTCSINKNTANANIMLRQPVDLINTKTNQVVAEVAGIRLDLHNFNNYTVVGNGEVSLKKITARTSDKRCFAELQEIGAIDKSVSYDPKNGFEIRFDTLPLVDYNAKFEVEDGAFDRLTQLTVAQKLLSASTKGTSDSLSSEQIAELKTYHLTPSLNFSPPTTTAYADLATALDKGEVDTRLKYTINLGSTELTSLDKLHSGNAYLQRRFVVTVDGKEMDKPTMETLANPNAKFSVKNLSARTQLDKVDAVSYPLYASLLEVEDPSLWNALVDSVGVDSKDFRASMAGDAVTRAEALRTLNRAVVEEIDKIQDRIRPLAFYVGASGLIPESLKAGNALTAEEFSAKYPSTKLSSDEKKEGMFYVLPNNHVLTVSLEAERFTVTK